MTSDLMIDLRILRSAYATTFSSVEKTVSSDVAIFCWTGKIEACKRL